MNYTEALEHYLAYIQNLEYEIPAEALKALKLGEYAENDIQTIGTSTNTSGTAVPVNDVTNLTFKDGNGNTSEFGLLSYLFGNTVYNTLQNIPVLLRKTTAQTAKFPTSGTDLYAGPVTNLNSLSLPITNAVNNRGFWIDLQSNPGSSQIISCVAYIDVSRIPHICVVGLDASFNPVDKWLDLTEKGGGTSDLPQLKYESITFDTDRSPAIFTGYVATLPELDYTSIKNIEDVTFTPTVVYSSNWLSCQLSIAVDLTTISDVSLVNILQKLSKYSIIHHPTFSGALFSLDNLVTPSLDQMSQEFSALKTNDSFTLNFNFNGYNANITDSQLDEIKEGNVTVKWNMARFDRTEV